MQPTLNLVGIEAIVDEVLVAFIVCECGFDRLLWDVIVVRDTSNIVLDPLPISD